MPLWSLGHLVTWVHHCVAARCRGMLRVANHKAHTRHVPPRGHALLRIDNHNIHTERMLVWSLGHLVTWVHHCVAARCREVPPTPKQGFFSLVFFLCRSAQDTTQKKDQPRKKPKFAFVFSWGFPPPPKQRFWGSQKIISILFFWLETFPRESLLSGRGILMGITQKPPLRKTRKTCVGLFLVSCPAQSKFFFLLDLLLWFFHREKENF